jgi:L-fuconate dehydratase
MSVITGFRTADVRFPTSDGGHGSDAMNLDPDYSAAYLSLLTDSGLAGHSLVFTIGRGNDVQCAMLAMVAESLIGTDVDTLDTRMGEINRALNADSHVRWLGPEKGIAHMAVGGVMNALWDLLCRKNNRPLWLQLAGMSPDELVDLVDFRYLEDALTKQEARDILQRMGQKREANIEYLLANGLPAYTTTPGWLGYSDERMVELTKQAIADGFTLIKYKVGGSIERDRHRLSLAREVAGPDIKIAIDANQVWGVPDGIEWINALKDVNIYWVEEPTSPDDVLGYAAIARGVAPTRLAGGEHVHNRIMFKQFLQAQAIAFMQIDATRVGGVNENVANVLLAAKFGIPVCPHAGGVGLCEMVQHFSFFDAAAVSGLDVERHIEFVDHLHEHFVEPTNVVGGRYLAPVGPGIGAEMFPASIAEYSYPDGPIWASRLA